MVWMGQRAKEDGCSASRPSGKGVMGEKTVTIERAPGEAGAQGRSQFQLGQQEERDVLEQAEETRDLTDDCESQGHRE